MRLFGGERIKALVDRISGGEEIPIEYGMMTRQIEKAQKRIEERNFQTRSHVLKYDDVMNKQREVIYGQRRKVLMGEDLKDTIQDMLESVVGDVVKNLCPDNQYPEEWDLAALKLALAEIIPADKTPLFEGMDLQSLNGKKARELIVEQAKKAYAAKEEELASQGADMRDAERLVLLRVVDNKWMDHIDNMDQLRQGIGLRAYGQTDPVVAYQSEGFDMFEDMIAAIQHDTIQMLFRITVQSRLERKQTMNPMSATHGEQSRKTTVKREGKKVGRNDPCPCGSGRKYKNCCGANQ